MTLKKKRKRGTSVRADKLCVQYENEVKNTTHTTNMSDKKKKNVVKKVLDQFLAIILELWGKLKLAMISIYLIITHILKKMIFNLVIL